MKLTAKFRIKNGVPFSIETVSGTQFRCGICGKVFYKRIELERHLLSEKKQDNTDLKFPRLNENVSVNVIYTQNIRDRTNPLYPKLRKGDKFLKIKLSDEKNLR